MSSFTIRVYGIAIENNRVLVSDEFIYGKYITKFPGGGLQFGEGTIECLVREMKEETNQSIEVGEHLYTTDYFQPSAFNVSVQVMSIYYFFHFLSPILFTIKERPFDFEKLIDRAQSFRWINLSDLKEDDLTLPIDRKVAEMIKGRSSK